MEIIYSKMSIWVALIVQFLLFHWMDNSTASQVKSVRNGKRFYPGQETEDDESKLHLRDLMHKRSDDNADQNQHSHNVLLIDVSNLGNMDNKKAGFNSKPKLIEIDTSVLSRPILSTFPNPGKLNDGHGIFPSNFNFDDEIIENEQYGDDNDETNDIFPFPLDLFNDPTIDIVSMRHSSQTNAVPYNFPYTHSNTRGIPSEKSQKFKQNLFIRNTDASPLDTGTGISSHQRVPTLLSVLKRNVLQRKLPYY